MLEKYGINEMADIFIEKIEHDDFGNKIYLPFLYMDTLKIYSHNITSENIKINGGNNHSDMISYSFNKNIKVKVQDALISNTSYSLLLGSKFTVNFNNILDYCKKYLNVQNDTCLLTEKLYDKINYSYIKLSENDKNAILIFSGYTAEKLLIQSDYLDCIQKIIDNINLSFKTDEGIIDFIGIAEMFPQDEIKINSVKSLKKIEVINKCIAKKEFAIDTTINKKHNLLKNNLEFKEKDIVIYLNPKTMQPYNYNIRNWKNKEGYFKSFKKGEEYYKFERKNADENTDYGKQITIEAKLTNGEYKITGITKKRNLNGKDEFYQICFPKVSMNFNNNFELNESSPVVLDFEFDVLEDENKDFLVINTFNGRINENGSFEIIENKNFFHNENKNIEVFTTKRIGLNIYVSMTEPSNAQIVEGSIWIKRNPTHEMIYILDRIDTNDDYTNSIIVFTRDGFEEVNLYSGNGFTTLLNVRQIQYSNGELVQILPYWIYRDGVWISNSTTLTQGVKLKLKNFSINVNNNFNETSFVGIENVSINEVENEYGSLAEIFEINVNETIEIGLSSMVENVTI